MGGGTGICVNFFLVAPSGTQPQGNRGENVGVVNFSGEVSRGKSFKKTLWGDLDFVLKPAIYGWDITVARLTDTSRDFVSVITPPYRADNPRYIGTAYGHSAVEAVAWTPRRFSFVVNDEGYLRASDAVRKILWPSGGSASDPRPAEMSLDLVPRANGVLKIRQAKISTADGVVESMTFDVEIHPPMDLEKALRKKFLQRYPEYETVEEACPEMDEPIHIGKALYHDFDGDGFDEVAVLAYSCLAGTGGSDLIGVFTRSSSWDVVEVKIDDTAFTIGKVRYNLRGHVDIKVENGRFVEEFPVYRANDPNCCATGGVRRFYYRWNGKTFLADNVEDFPAEENR